MFSRLDTQQLQVGHANRPTDRLTDRRNCYIIIVLVFWHFYVYLCQTWLKSLSALKCVYYKHLSADVRLILYFYILAIFYLLLSEWYIYYCTLSRYFGIHFSVRIYTVDCWICWPDCV